MDGPLEDRSCTDILFLAFFAAFMVGMVRGPLEHEEILTVTITISVHTLWYGSGPRRPSQTTARH